MTMRVSEETKAKLEAIKSTFELDSLEDAVNYLVGNSGVECRGKFTFTPKLWNMPFELLPTIDINEFYARTNPKGTVTVVTNVGKEDWGDEKFNWGELIVKDSIMIIVHRIMEKFAETNDNLYHPIRYTYYLAKEIGETTDKLVIYAYPTS